MNDVHEVFSLSGICVPSLKNLSPCVTITTIITDTGIERRDSMYQFESRVRYSEVDSERHLTLPAVMDYLQDCCTFQSEDMNIGVEYLAEQKQAWVLSSWEIKIRRYPVMGEKICVETWPYAFKGFYGYRNFRITNGQGEELVLANSVWVYMDMERMRPMRIPEKVADAYRPEIGEELPGEWGARKLSVPEGGTEMPPVPVAGFFIDTNHHMNNGKYILVAKESVPEDFAIGGVRAEYRRAAMLGDVLYPVVAVAEEKITVVLTDGGDQIYAIEELMENEDRDEIRRISEVKSDQKSRIWSLSGGA